VEPGYTYSQFEHEAVRISLLVYSFLVVFPIPFAHGPYSELREQLQSIIIDKAASSLPKDVVLWAVSLGAISESADEENGQWFVEKLRDLLTQTGISSWNAYKLAVQSVIWQETVLDPFMQRIWLSHILVV